MTLSKLIKKHPNLAKRQVQSFELDGPHVRKDGYQEIRVILKQLESDNEKTN